MLPNSCKSLPELFILLSRLITEAGGGIQGGTLPKRSWSLALPVQTFIDFGEIRVPEERKFLMLG